MTHGKWQFALRALVGLALSSSGCAGYVDDPAGTDRKKSFPPGGEDGDLEGPGQDSPEPDEADSASDDPRNPSGGAVRPDGGIIASRSDAGTTVSRGTDAASGQRDVGVATAAPRPVFEQRFDGLATGATWLSSCKWNKHVRVTERCGVGNSKCLRIAQDPFNREPPLFPLPPESQRPPYPDGSDGVCFPYYTNTGTDVVQAVQRIRTGMEYSLNYDMYFEPGYDWARAGKLPGLSAKQWDSGCSIEGDGLKTDPGAARWSVRLMWRDNGTNELYVYDQDRIPGACGARGPTNTPFETGRWIAVTIYLKLNSTATARDGVAALYLDGQLVRREQDLRLRATDTTDSRINYIFFSTFYGGNESKRLHCLKNPNDTRYCIPRDPRIETTWVPTRTSYVRFDNIAVHPGLYVRDLRAR